MYKLLAIDMDGTLLKDDKTISEVTLNAIQKALKKGVHVVLSSGRSMGGITDYLRKLDLLYKDEYAITMNGCSVQDVVSENYLYKKTLTSYDIELIIDLGEKLNATIVLVTNEYYCVNKYSDFLKADATINNLNLRVINFKELPKNTDIFKIMFVDNNKFLNKITPLIPTNFKKNYTLIRSGDNFLEFINKDANKGTGVAYLAKMLGIMPGEVICIGDAENDSHMIKYAGLGIAMGNAHDSVKNIADYVTKTNEEDGVAHVINKFILGF